MGEDKNKAGSFRLNPSQVITLSFLVLIIIGGLLLNLPAASRSGERVGLLNALFTATSAVCVTGLVVVNTLEHWTLFGKLVILALIQLGALGFMTILTLLLVVLRQKISLRSRLIIQAAYNQEGIGGMVRLVKKVILFTMVLEGAGAVLLTLVFLGSDGLPLPQALWKGVFHSVSAFCNGGFDIVGRESLTPYQGNLPLNAIIMALIILGGIGFTVLAELAALAGDRKRSVGHKIRHLSLHTKIALTVTGFLIFSGTLLFLLLEWENPATLGGMPFWRKLLAALFQSVTLRTAGFNTISQADLTEASRFLSCLFMMVGGSPAGTAGGMKTVSFGVIVISMLSVLRGRKQIEAFGRSLPLDLLLKALTVASAVGCVVIVSTILLCFTEAGSSFDSTFLDLLFECSSAAGTAGITTGITPYLSSPGKVVIIICMFLGRLSPVTVVVALNMRIHAQGNQLEYLEERVIIG